MIVPTKAVADDAVARLELERKRIVVIPEAPDAAMSPRSPREIADVRERFSLPDRYLVWVGSLQHPDPRQHVAQLAAAPREMPLVMVGPTKPWAHELPDVILTGQVSDEHLAAIYSGAHSLVLASEEEGFGLPAVEALACGTPVVACDCAALREVHQQRLTFVEQGDLESLLKLAQAATRPAPPPPAWTWEDAARKTWAVYEQALEETASVRTWAPGASRRSQNSLSDG